MTKQIKTIPATLDQNTSKPINSNTKRRVAGYARVSTDNEDQANSYEAQVDYYTGYIQNRTDWSFVNVYTDEGISGTSTAKRAGFNTMVADALNGKIDLIVTKSVSRFARNTVDSLTTIRDLKEHGIEVFFEKENIWTFESSGELLLTIMSSISQEESRSISLNVTWGIRKGMQDGKVHLAYSNFLGYDKGEDGNLVVNEEQAKVIKKIYAFFIQGLASKQIAKKLTVEKIPTPSGLKKWSPSTVDRILRNEKFKGDALLQKTFTTSYLTKKIKKNDGEIPQYYIEGNHEAIIDPVVFDWVQEKIKQRNKSYSSKYLFCSKIYCGECGSVFGRKIWHSNTSYRKYMWICNGKYKKRPASLPTSESDPPMDQSTEGQIQSAEIVGMRGCLSPSISEDEVKNAFLKAVNTMLQGREKSIAIFELAIAAVLDTSELEISLATVNAEIRSISEKDALCESQTEMIKVKGCQSVLRKQINSKKRRRKAIDEYISQLKSQEEKITDFSAELFSSLLDHVTVRRSKYRKELTFTFWDGTSIPVKV